METKSGIDKPTNQALSRENTHNRTMERNPSSVVGMMGSFSSRREGRANSDSSIRIVKKEGYLLKNSLKLLGRTKWKHKYVVLTSKALVKFLILALFVLRITINKNSMYTRRNTNRNPPVRKRKQKKFFPTEKWWTCDWTKAPFTLSSTRQRWLRTRRRTRSRRMNGLNWSTRWWRMRIYQSQCKPIRRRWLLRVWFI